jgi:hypothetical protein
LRFGSLTGARGISVSQALAVLTDLEQEKLADAVRSLSPQARHKLRAALMNGPGVVFRPLEEVPEAGH